jgi:hypothetical protein
MSGILTIRNQRRKIAMKIKYGEKFYEKTCFSGIFGDKTQVFERNIIMKNQ